MTASRAATSAAPAVPAVPQGFRAVPRSALVLWATAVLVMGFGLWAVTRSDAPPPAYYVVRWAASGKCAVVTEPPPRARAKLLWFSMLQESAAEKSKEFRKSLRCN